MSFRDALEQSPLLTLGVAAALAWTAFSVTRVLGQFDYWAPEAVGMTPAAGIVGVIVMLVGVTLGFAVLSGFGHDEPTADTWPPEDAEQRSATGSWSEESFERDDSTDDRLPSEGTSTE